ncbi:MAG: hypothetical protein J5636_11120 [Clostridiales bacterium]|nr:hypothetical protein [Clostridiales bacterium]
MEKETEAARRDRRKTAKGNTVRHHHARSNNVQRAKKMDAPSGRPSRVRHINVVGNDYAVRRVPATRQAGKRNVGYCATGSTVQVRCCQR